jgi:hypothetical protein
MLKSDHASSSGDTAPADGSLAAHATPRLDPHHRSRPGGGSTTNPLLDWLEERSLRPTLRPIDEIIARASALVCELGELLPFASGTDALAFAILDEFARDRLLHPAEVAMLMVDPVNLARGAIRELVQEHDELVVEIARLDRTMGIRKRGGADPTARRDRGQVRR